VSEYALDFDQRHTVTAVISYRVPWNWNGRLFGLSLPSAWGISMVGHYGSGLPYTATDADGNRLGERNEGRLPANYTVDMRFNKEFAAMGKGMPLTLFVEVDNLFNRLNVIDVYTKTGQSDNDGEVIQSASSSTQAQLNYFDRLYDHDPQNFSPPRTVRVGMELKF
jgi:hypothetical protein